MCCVAVFTHISIHWFRESVKVCSCTVGPVSHSNKWTDNQMVRAFQIKIYLVLNSSTECISTLCYMDSTTLNLHLDVEKLQNVQQKYLKFSVKVLNSIYQH